MGYLRAIPAFKSWSKLELKAANNGSKIVDYPANIVRTSFSICFIHVLISKGEILINVLAMKCSSTLTFILCSTVDVPQAV
jgi:hypothetical protein